MDVNRDETRFPKSVLFIFYGLILLLLWPLLKLSFILTHDGPAHVYNACLIKEIIFSNSIASEFLTLKKFPEPNWTGHFIILLLSSVFNPNTAEKIFLGGYVFFFPYFFRKLLLKVNVNSGAFCLLVIPFVYSYFFIGGLYNFIAGITILFAGLNFVLPEFEKESFRKYISILVFALLLYFSHLLTLGVFLILIFLAHLFSSFSKNNSGNPKRFIRNSWFLFLALLPSLVLLFFFFLKKFSLPESSSAVSFTEMKDALIYISPLMTFGVDPERIFSLFMFIFLFALLLYLLFAGISNKMKVVNAAQPFYRQKTFWSIAAILMLIFFFFIPDKAASGGVIKFRFELFFFLFIIIVIGAFQAKRFLNITISIIISAWTISKFSFLYPQMKSLDENTKLAMSITDHMKENSLLLPLNYSWNWMHCNMLNYAGTVKNILVLDNYEAGVAHFPLEWKEGKNPVSIMGSFNGDPPLCADIPSYEKQTGHKIDYVLIYSDRMLTDSCTVAIKNTIGSEYSLIYQQGEGLKLYGRK